MKKMKIVVALMLVLSMVLAFGACGNGAGKTLTMATNAAFPPYEYVEGGNIVGIDAEIAQLIADKLGMKLVISDMEFDLHIGCRAKRQGGYRHGWHDR